MVEGKDTPPQILKQFSQHRKTVGLLLHMLQLYFHTARYIVLNSGFCVLKGIIELHKNGLFGCALIKKWRYWPADIPGDAMQQFFDADGVNVGDNHAIAGTMDEVAHHLWGMKEPDYVMRMMSSGGPLSVYPMCKEAVCKWKEDGIEVIHRFRYTCPFEWHFHHHHAADNHNNLHHGLPMVEDSWITQRWEVCVFLFVLSISKVNAFLALWCFTFAKGTIDDFSTLIVFCQRLAWQLIRNSWIAVEEMSARLEGITSVHRMQVAPNHAKVYPNQQWVCTAVARHQQYRCTNDCGKKIRTYCACSPGTWVCYQCFPDHVRSSDLEA